HRGLAYGVSRGLPGAAHCRPASGLPRESAAGIQERRAQPTVDARRRRVAFGQGHVRRRGLLRAGRLVDEGEMTSALRLAFAAVALALATTAHATDIADCKAE